MAAFLKSGATSQISNRYSGAMHDLKLFLCQKGRDVNQATDNSSTEFIRIINL